MTENGYFLQGGTGGSVQHVPEVGDGSAVGDAYFRYWTTAEDRCKYIETSLLLVLYFKLETRKIKTNTINYIILDHHYFHTYLHIIQNPKSNCQEIL